MIDRTLVRKHNLFALEVVKAWTDPSQRRPKVLHHVGYGTFAVGCRIVRLKSRMR